MELIKEELQHMPKFISNDSIGIICSYINDLIETEEESYEQIARYSSLFRERAEQSYDGMVSMIYSIPHIWVDSCEYENDFSEFLDTGETLEDEDEFYYCTYASRLTEHNQQIMGCYISYAQNEYFNQILQNITDCEAFFNKRLIKVGGEDNLIIAFENMKDFRKLAFDIINDWGLITKDAINGTDNIKDLLPGLAWLEESSV